jgi:hypothetical protein
VNVVGFNSGEAPIDEERFINRRAKLHWALRKARAPAANGSGTAVSVPSG